MGRSSICHFVVCLLFAAGALSAAAGEQANPAPEEPAKAEPAAQGFTWFDNYGLAMKHAEQQKQLLLVVFTDANRQLHPNLDELFGSADLQPLLADVTAVKLPVDARVQVGGKPLRLLGHHAFSELQGQAGLAIIDLRDADSRYFRQVVSIFPFHAGRTLDSFQLRTLLTLPSGSLTQRTLVFAVRTHPERPQSALASWHPVLAAEAESHSGHQANIGLQGHHQWESRFHRISGQIGSTATEVCAESWPGQGLFAAALECVHSWRQSSGHWSAVSGRQRLFGYDMKLGRNGIWYATGIFGR